MSTDLGTERRVPTLGRIVHVYVQDFNGSAWRAAIVSLDAEDSLPYHVPRATTVPVRRDEPAEIVDLSPHLEFTGSGDPWHGRWRWPPRV